MIFHNSKYKNNFRRPKNPIKCSSASFNSVSDSAIVSEPESFIQSPSSTLSKTSFLTECPDINVILEPEKCLASRKKPESDSFLQPEEPRFSNICVSSKYRENANSMSFVSEESSYHIETVVPRKSSD